MCGRYALAYPPAEVAQRLIENGMPVDEQPPAHDVRHGYNIAPGSFQPVYRALGEREQEEVPGGGGVAVRYGLQAMWWGLPTPGLPTHSSKAPHKAINIRDTTLRLVTGPWHTLRDTHRCLIPALGFYEWRSQNTPYFVKRHDGALMCFAGLWSPQSNGATATATYAIVTTAAAPQLRFLHERMPVILEMGSKEAKAWVDPAVGWSERLQGLCVPWEGELDVYAVPAEVGDVKKDQRRFIEPIKGGIESFFGKAAAAESKEGHIKEEDIKEQPEDIKAGDIKEEDIKKEHIKEEDIEEEGVKGEDSTKSWEETPAKSSITKNEPSIDDDGWEIWPEAYQAPPSESTEPSTPSPTPTTSLKRARSVGSSTPPAAPASKVTKSGNTPWVRSATSNAANRRTPPSGKKKAKDTKNTKDGTPKITSFFRK